MLKLIPQEQPEKPNKRRSKNSKSKKSRKATNSPNEKPKAARQKSRNILSKTSEQLAKFTAEPEKHTDREVADIILSMHRSILHLQQVRQKNHNKRQKNRGHRNK